MIISQTEREQIPYFTATGMLWPDAITNSTFRKRFHSSLKSTLLLLLGTHEAQYTAAFDLTYSLHNDNLISCF